MQMGLFMKIYVVFKSPSPSNFSIEDLYRKRNWLITAFSKIEQN